MRHALPPLPFERNSLEPMMSKETLDFHHGKHHRAYVEKLNKLIAGTQFENFSLEEIIQRADGPIFNNAAQAWNHAFFWNCLSPEGSDANQFPKGSLASPSPLEKMIEKKFTSLESFSEKWIQAGTEHFGSGWIWLVCSMGQDRELEVYTSHDAATPIRDGKTPLLVCDLWEHAYYIDYRNERPKFLSAFLKLVNWQFAMANFENAYKSATRAA